MEEPHHKKVLNVAIGLPMWTAQVRLGLVEVAQASSFTPYPLLMFPKYAKVYENTYSCPPVAPILSESLCSLPVKLFRLVLGLDQFCMRYKGCLDQHDRYRVRSESS